MPDLYSQFRDYEERRDTKFPTSGTIARIDGSLIDVRVPGASTVLRNIKVVGSPTSTGQPVVLTWENGIPTAHVTGGLPSGTSVALIRGPQGATGPQGEQGPAGPEGPAGSLTTSSPVELVELASPPANPPAGSMRIYPKTDHKFRTLAPDGSEKELSEVGHTHSTYDMLICYGDLVSVPGSTTYYMAPGKVGATAMSHNMPFPINAVVEAMYVRTGNNQPNVPAGNSDLIFQFATGGAGTPSGLAVTVPGGGASTTRLAEYNVSVPAGTLVRINVINNSSSPSAQITYVTLRVRYLSG